MLVRQQNKASPPYCAGRRLLRFRLLRLLRPHVDATVHVEGGAGHVFVLDAKADGLGDVLGLAEAAHGDRLEDLLLHLLGYRADHVRLYKARANGVDGDTVPREFQRGRLGVPEQAGLSCRVVGLAQVSRFADEGAHVDDRAVLLLYHVRQHRVHSVEATIQVQLHDLVPALHVELVQRGVGVYAGVVDQYINPAELLYRLVYELLRVLGVRDVSLDRHRFSPASDLVDLLGHLFGRTLAAGVVDHDLGARTTQIFAYRGPYAPASARNDRNRPLQVQNSLPFRRVCFRTWRILLPFPARSKLCVQGTQAHKTQDDSRAAARIEASTSPGCAPPLPGPKRYNPGEEIL